MCQAGQRFWFLVECGMTESYLCTIAGLACEIGPAARILDMLAGIGIIAFISALTGLGSTGDSGDGWFSGSSDGGGDGGGGD